MEFHLFTDGACQPNPGFGGWAFVVYPEDKPQKKMSCSGYEKDTTNNRMEITAVLEGLLCITNFYKQKANLVLLCADSKYLLNGIESWMHNWVKNNWRRKDVRRY